MHVAVLCITDLRSCRAVIKALGVKELEISAGKDWKPLWIKIAAELCNPPLVYRQITNGYGNTPGYVIDGTFVY